VKVLPRPSSLSRFVVLCALQLWAVVLQSPGIWVHWLFTFFVSLTILLIIFQSRWYYATLVLSIVVVLITYKEGLVAMEEE